MGKIKVRYIAGRASMVNEGNGKRKCAFYRAFLLWVWVSMLLLIEAKRQFHCP